jgi:CheY-like chemotaxis protein
VTHVLLIEDEGHLRGLMSEELQDLGYRVSEAENGAVALDISAAETPDIILCDMAMPVMSGLEFMRAYGARFAPPRAPVIVASAYGTEDDVSQAKAAGASRYLRKPIDFDELEAVLTEFAPVA